MIADELQALLAQLREDVFADKGKLDQVEKQLKAGEISRAEAYRRLTQVQHDLSVRPLQFSPQEMQSEWETLSAVLEEAEKRWERLAKNQFRIGLVALPIAIVLVLGSLLLGWHQDAGATTVAALLTACLAALAAHSFLVLRIHQQAGLAAERLSEKRVGAIFLRLATAREDPAERERLLQAGTSMFLGHHAPATLPLEGGDFSIAKS
jgi:hypothetical protein